MPQRGIDTALWTNPDFEDISSEAKYLFLYLCTTFRGNQAGLYRITERQIEYDTGLSQDKLPGLFQEIKVMDVEWYQDRRIVWVKQFLKHQAHSPKYLSAVAKNLEGIHYQDLIEAYLSHNDTLPIPYQDGMDTVSNTETETVAVVGTDQPEWLLLLLELKQFNFTTEWIEDIEVQYSGIDLEAAAMEFREFWRNQPDKVNVTQQFINSLDYARTKGKFKKKR